MGYLKAAKLREALGTLLVPPKCWPTLSSTQLALVNATLWSVLNPECEETKSKECLWGDQTRRTRYSDVGSQAQQKGIPKSTHFRRNWESIPFCKLCGFLLLRYGATSWNVNWKSSLRNSLVTGIKEVWSGGPWWVLIFLFYLMVRGLPNWMSRICKRGILAPEAQKSTAS